MGSLVACKTRSVTLPIIQRCRPPRCLPRRGLWSRRMSTLLQGRSPRSSSMGLREASLRPQIRSPQGGRCSTRLSASITRLTHWSGLIPASILLSRASGLLSCGDFVSAQLQHDRTSRFNSCPTEKSSGPITTLIKCGQGFRSQRYTTLPTQKTC
jgi:hypothetical protein